MTPPDFVALEPAPFRPAGRNGPALTLVPASATAHAGAHEGYSSEVSPLHEVHRREATYRRLLMVADGGAAVGASILATLFAGQSPRWFFLLPAVIAIVVAKVQGLYDRDDVVINKSSVAEWRSVLQLSAITAVGVYLGWRLVTDAQKGGGVRLLLFLGCVTFLLDMSGRVGARAIARVITPHERVLIIGEPRRCVQLASYLTELTGVELIGTVPIAGLDGSLEEIGAVVTHLHTHRLVIVPDTAQREVTTLQMIRSAKALGVRVSLMPTIMAVVGGGATFDDIHGLTLLGVPRFGLTRSSQMLKRAFDLAGAACAIVFALPILAVLGLLIKVDSRGPVLFRQTRVGRDGKHFQILKLRTMVDGADAMKRDLLAGSDGAEGLFKMVDDPRITRVGKHLRALHIDELPQVFNVLVGDMSLVGPRPLVVEEDEQLDRTANGRLKLTPGITGPWQIRGPLNASLAEMSRLDYLYISNWSIWRDVDILIKTVMRVAARGGH